MRDPVRRSKREGTRPGHVRLLPRPLEMFSPERPNSRGHGAGPADRARRRFGRDRSRARQSRSRRRPSSAARCTAGQVRSLVLCPHDRRQRIGMVHTADAGDRSKPPSRAPRRGALPWDRLGGPGAGRDPGERRRSLRARSRAADGGDGARGRQDAGQCAGRRARGHRLPALLRRGSAPAVCGAGIAQGPDGRDQHHRAARPRPVCLHQPVEFSAGDFHGPGGGRARRRQSGARQTGRADADRRVPRRRSCCTRPVCPGDVLHLLPGGGDRRRGAGEGSACCGRRLHGLERDRHGRFKARSPAGAAPWCPSSPRPAASMP